MSVLFQIYTYEDNRHFYLFSSNEFNGTQWGYGSTWVLKRITSPNTSMPKEIALWKSSIQDSFTSVLILDETTPGESEVLWRDDSNRSG